MVLIDTLKETRKKAKITQAVVADHLQITQGYYSKIENGKSDPPLSLFLKALAFVCEKHGACVTFSVDEKESS